jgi:hypothetical protein
MLPQSTWSFARDMRAPGIRDSPGICVVREMRQELRSSAVSPAVFVLRWNNRRAGALYPRPTRSRTRVVQKGRLLPQGAPFPFWDGFSYVKAPNPLGLTSALKLPPAFPLRSRPVGRRHFDPHTIRSS